MNAIKKTFSMSSHGTNQSAKIRIPDRQDKYVLNYYGRHINLKSCTILHGNEFGVIEESLTRMSSNSIMKAVYYMTAIRNIRITLEQAEHELFVLGRAMKEQGVLFDADFPVELRYFVAQDSRLSEKLHQKNRELLDEKTLTLVVHQLIGIKSFL